jgi:hypothetical protein
MKSKIIIGVIVMMLILILYLLQQMVEFMDGNNNKPQMIELSKGYFYDRTEKDIWQFEKQTDCYTNIINKKIDSLSYNEDYIIGYANKNYFIINVKNGSIEFQNNKENLVEFKQILFKNIPEVTPLK